ncbi:MAG: hypothetical protein VYC39_16460 [Myxococcota bacterium]|nr:hypothetical protein [Myxococcota bacterium]
MNLISLFITAQCAVGSIPSDTVSYAIEMKSNRTWDILPGELGPKKALEVAVKKMGVRQFRLAGVLVDKKALENIRRRFSGKEALNRPFREHLGLPIDAADFLYFLDDLLAVDVVALLKNPVELSAASLRNSGIFVHPDDVFFGKPRKYGEAHNPLRITTRSKKAVEKPAVDGSYIGPRWALRFQQPETESKRLWALYRENPDFTQRVRSLVKQLRKQGAFVTIESTVRDRRRGFLLYASFVLSRVNSEKKLQETIQRLNELRELWGLNVDVKFMHQAHWRESVRAAKELAHHFGVTYATVGGAKNSSHYDGKAVDIYAIALPRVVTLVAPNGKKRRFDLYADHHSRDLNLSPKMIDWIEENFEFRKLRKDYPHWSDNARPR